MLNESHFILNFHIRKLKHCRMSLYHTSSMSAILNYDNRSDARFYRLLHILLENSLCLSFSILISVYNQIKILIY